MTDYSVLSDFEINKRVFKAVMGAKPLGYPHNADGRSVGNEANGNYKWYDYCNNPTDAMPIIIENKISIAFDTNENEWLAWGDFEFDQCGWDMINEPTIYCSHANPLRAAMIVFLKMQENNHD